MKDTFYFLQHTFQSTASHMPAEFELSFNLLITPHGSTLLTTFTPPTQLTVTLILPNHNHFVAIELFHLSIFIRNSSRYPPVIPLPTFTFVTTKLNVVPSDNHITALTSLSFTPRFVNLLSRYSIKCLLQIYSFLFSYNILIMINAP